MSKKPLPQKEKSKTVVISVAQELNVDVDLRRLHESCSTLGDYIAPFMKRVKTELQRVKDGEQPDVPTLPLFVHSGIPFAEGKILFTEVLPSYPYLRVIQLHHCAVGDDGMIAIVDFIRSYKPTPDKNPFGIQCLEVPGCLIGPIGAKHLGKLLAENDTISRCVLDFNPLGDAGAKILANDIRWNGSLEELSMQYCKIGASGVEALAEGVLRCSNVRLFSLRGNVLGEEGIRHIALSLSIGNHIESIDVADTRFSDSFLAVESFCQGIESSCSLTSVDMDLNVVVPEAAELIANAILKNERLTHCRVYERMNPDSYMMILNALEQNSRGKKGKKKKKSEKT